MNLAEAGTFARSGLAGTKGVFPPFLGGNQRRRYARYSCSKQAMVTVGRGPTKRSLKGTIINFSETGASVSLTATKTPLVVGQVITLNWRPDRLAAGTVYTTEKDEQDCELEATVMTRREGDGRSTDTYGLRFHQTIDEGVRETTSRVVRMRSAVFAVIVAAAIIYIKTNTILNPASHWFFRTYSFVAGVFFFSRVLIARYYREPEDKGYLPKVSVVIAAKNEEDCIEPTILHVIRSRYPAELMEIIAIDDGSTDRTWEMMEDVKRRYPQIQTIRFEKNRGKRHGMAAGAVAATGDILIYVDSDSFVEEEAIYRIVQGFVDPKIGAIAGHTLVLLEENNFFSKMESVRYYISHRVLKAAESVFGAVTCCPGAFSAYRRETVMSVLDAWLNQKFLGVQATFGDDRSLTNFILRTHKVIFHNGARAVTKVPDAWMKYFKQQLRWKKSWCRETFNACRIMFWKNPIASLSYYAGVFLTIFSPIVVIRSLIYMPVVASTNPALYLAGLMLSYVLLGLMCRYYAPNTYWFHGVYFAVLYLTVLCWQNYYALFTINKTAWGTR